MEFKEETWLYIIIILLIILVGFSFFKITSLPKDAEEDSVFIPTFEETGLNNYKIVVVYFGGYDGEIDYDNKVVSIWGSYDVLGEKVREHEIKARNLNSVLVKDVDVLGNLSVTVYKNGEYLDSTSTYGRSNYLLIEF